jgi:hypothetical protein
VVGETSVKGYSCEKIIWCRWDGLKLTYICIDDESVFRLHVRKKKQGNKHVDLGVILHGRGRGGCEFYLRV